MWMFVLGSVTCWEWKVDGNEDDEPTEGCSVKCGSPAHSGVDAPSCWYAWRQGSKWDEDPEGSPPTPDRSIAAQSEVKSGGVGWSETQRPRGFQISRVDGISSFIHQETACVLLPHEDPLHQLRSHSGSKDFTPVHNGSHGAAALPVVGSVASIIDPPPNLSCWTDPFLPRVNMLSVTRASISDGPAGSFIILVSTDVEMPVRCNAALHRTPLESQHHVL